MEQQLEVVRPEYVDLENKDERLTIRWRWSGPLGRKLLFLTLFISLYSVLCGLLPPIITLTRMSLDWKGVASSFCFPPLGFALFFIYYLLASYLNQTQVTIDKK